MTDADTPSDLARGHFQGISMDSPHASYAKRREVATAELRVHSLATDTQHSGDLFRR